MLSYPPESWAVGDAIVRQCGKMLVLDRLLVKMKLSGHRRVERGGGGVTSCRAGCGLGCLSGGALWCVSAALL